MEPKLAKQLANPMLVRRGELWPAQDGERGRGWGMAQQGKHADLAMNSSSQIKLMTFKKSSTTKNHL